MLTWSNRIREVSSLDRSAQHDLNDLEVNDP